MWKFVDDIPAWERLARNCGSDIQSNLDSITFMKLKDMKCREMRESPELSPLVINCHLHSHKLQKTLKWSDHINSVVSKASKRLYILRVLRQSGIPVEDLVTRYYALVRSLLEYFCVICLLALLMIWNLYRNEPLELSYPDNLIKKLLFNWDFQGWM